MKLFEKSDHFSTNKEFLNYIISHEECPPSNKCGYNCLICFIHSKKTKEGFNTVPKMVEWVKKNYIFLGGDIQLTFDFEE
jgi:hypothetical protein